MLNLKNVGFAVVVIAIVAVALWFKSNFLTVEAQAPANESDQTAIVEVVVPELAGNAAIGENVFNARCSACHGLNAAGNDGFGPPLVHRIYEPGHHGDMAFVLAAQRGVASHHWKFGNMPAVEDVTRSEVEMVIAYVRALQVANGIR